MKKIIYILLPIIMFFPMSIYASTVVCKSASRTVTFDTVTHAVSCVDNDGKSHNWYGNAVDKAGNGFEVLNDVTNTYYALKDVNSGKCPDYFIIDTNNADTIWFYNNGPYTYQDYGDDGSLISTQTWTIDTIREYIMKVMNYTSDKKKDKVLLETVTKDYESGGGTCDSDVMSSYNALNFADSEFTNHGCDGDKAKETECETYYNNLKTKLTESEQVYYKYNSDATCALDSITNMQSLLDIARHHIENYEKDNAEKTTKEKKEKTYDFSNDGCPLGEEVTKDLSGALKVMKILAPIFVFVYTVYDTIVALTKGDAQAEGKKMLQKFLKRMAAALVLFAIPVLIDVLFQLFNIWDSNGKCEFNGGSNTKVETEIKENTTKAWTLNDCLTNCKLIPDTNGRTSCENKCKTKSTCYANCENYKDEKGKANCRSKCNQ